MFVSAFCSVSEAALYSVPWSRIEELRKNGSPVGERLYALRLDIDKPITAILTLNTIAHTVGASLAGAAAAGVFGEAGLPLFAVVFTAIILIFSEIIPKMVGVVYTRSLSPALAGPLHWMVVVFTPFIWMFGFVSRQVKRGQTTPQATEDDIRAIASLTHKAGLINEDEETVIRNVLALDLKTVEQVMTPRTVVFSLAEQMTVGEAKGESGVWPHSRIPVYAADNKEDIVGLVYRRDVLRALASGLDTMTIGKMMRPVEFVLDTMPLNVLLSKFLQSRIHLFVVVDEYGGLAGVISLEDILEEILGKEIVDETDRVSDMRALAREKREKLTKGRAAGHGQQ